MCMYHINCGSRHPHSKTPTADGRYDFTGGVAAKDDSTGGHVLLHGSPEGMLCILGQPINFSQDHNCIKR